MAGINKVIIVGNLGSDPDLRYTQAGTAVCNLSIATTRTWSNKQTGEKQQETEWHRVNVWGTQAEHCSSYLAKGRQVYVEGYLRTSSYDKEGQKHYSTEIVAQTVQFLGGKPSNEEGDGQAQGGQQAGRQGGYRGQQGQRGQQGYGGGGAGARGGGQPDEDDDIPF